MGQTFPKTVRVRHRSDFLAAQGRGRRLHATHFVILLFDRQDGAPARLGLVTSGKVANAVRRNRIRRRLREVFRTGPEHFPLGHDVVIIAREGADGLALAAVRDEIQAALRRRGARASQSAAKGGRPS